MIHALLAVCHVIAHHHAVRCHLAGLDPVVGGRGGLRCILSAR